MASEVPGKFCLTRFTTFPRQSTKIALGAFTIILFAEPNPGRQIPGRPVGARFITL
jgi:hypothetical protein